jgi:hypothetical protein
VSVEGVKLHTGCAQEARRLARAPLEIGLGRVALAATTAQNEQDLTTAQSLSLARKLGEKLRVGVSTTPQGRMRESWCRVLDRVRALCEVNGL